MVTNPIQKSALYEAGFGYPGHTEYLAALAGWYRAGDDAGRRRVAGRAGDDPSALARRHRDAVHAMIVQCGASRRRA